MYDEGVIKFQAHHDIRPLEPRVVGTLCCRLVAWREIMAMTQLVGRDPTRYGGAGYGNVSGRFGAPSSPRGARSMLITGTQTGGIKDIGLEHFCVVQRYDYQRNSVESYGEISPSSETMTHGSIYDLSPRIRFVLHAHSPVIWRRSRELRIPTTGADVAYGTPAMAMAVQELWRSTPLSDCRILSMGGHEDGIIVFGSSCEEAGQVLLTYLARAYENTCRINGVGQ